MDEVEFLSCSGRARVQLLPPSPNPIASLVLSGCFSTVRFATHLLPQTNQTLSHGIEKAGDPEQVWQAGADTGASSSEENLYSTASAHRSKGAHYGMTVN
tara:strand:- start:775 stop:1074 length:300 start_codon:yes stop_codon:yes gene_type:complete